MSLQFGINSWGVGPAAPATPDSAVYQYDAQALDANDGEPISTLPDQIGDADATGGDATYRSNGINGNPALEFTQDSAENYKAAFTLNEPNTIIAVCAAGSPGSNAWVYDSNDSDDRHDVWLNGGSTWTSGSGAGDLTGSSDLDVQMLTVVYDGNDSELREDASQTASGDNNRNDAIDGLTVGDSFGDAAPWDGYIGEIIIYDDDLRGTGELVDEEQRIGGKWGVEGFGGDSGN